MSETENCVEFILRCQVNHQDLSKSIPSVHRTVPYEVVPLSAVPAFRQGTRRKGRKRDNGTVDGKVRLTEKGDLGQV